MGGQLSQQQRLGAFLANIVVGVGFALAYKFMTKTVTLGMVSSAGTAESIKLEASDEEVQELRMAAAWLETQVSLHK